MSGGGRGHASDEELRAFAGVPTSIISDCLERMPALVGLRPIHKNAAQMIGRALTVRCRSGDNAAFHRALELVRPGDVLVVDAGGDTGRAVTGEIMRTIAQSRGAVGFVVYGAVRDSDTFAASETFGCFTCGVIHRGPFKHGPGDVNVPVSIGDCVVHPGDVVVGDCDGVVTFPPNVIGQLRFDVRAQMQKEADILKSIAEGRYQGQYKG